MFRSCIKKNKFKSLGVFVILFCILYAVDNNGTISHEYVDTHNREVDSLGTVAEIVQIEEKGSNCGLFDNKSEEYWFLVSTENGSKCKAYVDEYMYNKHAVKDMLEVNIIKSVQGNMLQAYVYWR